MKLLKNKKVLIVVSSVFVIAIFTITLSLTLAKGNDNKVYQANKEEKYTNQVGGFLTLMLEIEAGSGQYQESTASTWPGDGYVFNSELSSCQNGSELSWNEELEAVTLSTTIADSCYVYFDKIIVDIEKICTTNDKMTDCLVKYYNSTGDMDNGMYYHDANLANGAGDNSYRYTGANPNNYVCLRNDPNECSNNDLYRIIGLFDSDGDGMYNMKLIKADYTLADEAGNDNQFFDYYSSIYSNTNYYKGLLSPSSIATYNLNGSDNNIVYSEFINNNLNYTYFKYLIEINNQYAYNIKFNDWNNFGIISLDIINNPPKNVYQYELGETSNLNEMNRYIGLMYITDYTFAASSKYWNTNINSYSNANNNNWLYLGLKEWTISQMLNNSNAFFINDDGNIGYSPANNTAYAIRPTIYLQNYIKYVSGNGSKESPFRFNEGASNKFKLESIASPIDEQIDLNVFDEIYIQNFDTSIFPPGATQEQILSMYGDDPNVVLYFQLNNLLNQYYYSLNNSNYMTSFLTTTAANAYYEFENTFGTTPDSYTLISVIGIVPSTEDSSKILNLVNNNGVIVDESINIIIKDSYNILNLESSQESDFAVIFWDLNGNSYLLPFNILDNNRISLNRYLGWVGIYAILKLK